MESAFGAAGGEKFYDSEISLKQNILSLPEMITEQAVGNFTWLR